MKILITGSNGFIAQHIIKDLLTHTEHFVIGSSYGDDRLNLKDTFPLFNYARLDISNEQEVYSVITFHSPDIIIHTAAIGSPDYCEQHKNECGKINIIGTFNVVKAAEYVGAAIIFTSTDFVFNGKGGPYKEEDNTDPVNYYGQSKVKSEQLIIKNSKNFCIIRLCSVYGNAFSGKARGIITLTKENLEQNKTINVVYDQFRTPTFVEDISTIILKIIEKGSKGLFHISGEEMQTPYDMAMESAAFFKLNKDLIKKVLSTDLKEPAKRPFKTGFIIDKAKKEFDFFPNTLKQGLLRMFV